MYTKSIIKRCSHCHNEKPFSAFNKCKARKFGLHNHCRECQKAVRRAWYLKHRKDTLEKSAAYYKTPAGIVNKRKKYWRNRDKILVQNRIRRRTEPAKAQARKQRERWLQKIENRLACNLRVRIRLALKDAVKSDTTLELLGCSLDEFKRYLESQFIEGMTWENYTYRGWHIDHKKPCAAFDLSNPEECRKCFHYTNLRPLWWTDNLAKSSKPYTVLG